MGVCWFRGSVFQAQGFGFRIYRLRAPTWREQWFRSFRALDV